MKDRIVGILSQVGRSTVIAIAPEDSVKRLYYETTSEVIQSVLVSAFFTGAYAPIETEGSTSTIKRVHAFERGPAPSIMHGEFRVTRLATQRNGETGVDHWEVFVRKAKDGSDEETYFVFDRKLAALVRAAFDYSAPFPMGVLLWMMIGGEGTVVGVGAGEMPPQRSK
jgi:hypothetical protein